MQLSNSFLSCPLERERVNKNENEKDRQLNRMDDYAATLPHVHGSCFRQNIERETSVPHRWDGRPQLLRLVYPAYYMIFCCTMLRGGIRVEREGSSAWCWIEHRA